MYLNLIKSFKIIKTFKVLLSKVMLNLIALNIILKPELSYN